MTWGVLRGLGLFVAGSIAEGGLGIIEWNSRGSAEIGYSVRLVWNTFRRLAGLTDYGSDRFPDNDGCA